MAKEYYNELNAERKRRTDAILRELPSVCRDFMQSIENNTSALTRLNYAFDLRLFYNYLCTYEYSPLKNSAAGETPDFRSITCEKLSSLNISDLRDYVSFIESYSVDAHGNLTDYVPPAAEKKPQATPNDADAVKEPDTVPRINTETGKKRKIASLRSFFKYLYNMELISENITTKLVTPKIHEKPIVRLDNDEALNMIKVVFSDENMTSREQKYHERIKLRDAAMIVLLLTTGIRVSELVGLNMSDIDFKNNAFTVTRKGGNTVILYFEELTAGYISAYVDQRKSAASYSLSSPLFISLKGSRITTRQVENIVKKYAAKVSSQKRISPHKLRSTFGTMLYNDTGDIYLVAEALGHKDVNTTKRHYAAMSENARKLASKSLSLNKEAPAVDENTKGNDDERSQ